MEELSYYGGGFFLWRRFLMMEVSMVMEVSYVGGLLL